MADSKGIEINAAGMQDFSTKLQDQVDKYIVPGSELIKNQLQFYPSFGIHSASPVVQSAAYSYWQRMEEAMLFLDTLSHNAAVLAKVAQEIVTTYRDADNQSVEFLSALEGGASTEVTRTEQANEDALQKALADEQRDRMNENRELHNPGGSR
ncbi:hypothetical protein AB0M46_16130 [Dactylosporangium sp. NPDC051485]|uniref:hypothetical protein n=1 Tax=Dactylosporangium sp. NPDC051485 TaxID=3154846 RepID=UPI00343A0732